MRMHLSFLCEGRNWVEDHSVLHRLSILQTWRCLQANFTVKHTFTRHSFHFVSWSLFNCKTPLSMSPEAYWLITIYLFFVRYQAFCDSDSFSINTRLLFLLYFLSYPLISGTLIFHLHITSLSIHTVYSILDSAHRRPLYILWILISYHQLMISLLMSF